MENPTVKAIGKSAFKWGEGSIWWNDCLLFVDIEGHKIVRLNPSNGEETVWEMGERVGTVVPDGDGNLIYAGDKGITRFNLVTGTQTPLADPEANKRATNRFNDGKCDPAGRFWAGTISTVKNEGDASLYMLDTGGQIHKKIDAVTNSNGICWSVDHKTMFYIDTPTKLIDAFDFDLLTGDISNRRTVIDTSTKGFASSPDGMTIDSEGNLWVAFCHGGCVACFNPEKDQLVRQIEIPCIETTSCAFGGPDLDRLFVTTGKHKSIVEENAGKIFVVDGLGVCGVPACAYKG